MISSTIYCVRACSDAQYCPTVYDEMGCYFFTSNGIGWDGVYQDCVGDEGDPPGVYVDEGGQTVTYTQGGGWPTFSIPAVSECVGGMSGGVLKTATAATSGTAVQTSASGAAAGGTEQVGVTRVGGGATGGAVTGGGVTAGASAASVASGAWGGRGRRANVIGANIAVIAVGCVLHALL